MSIRHQLEICAGNLAGEVQVRDQVVVPNTRMPAEALNYVKRILTLPNICNIGLSVQYLRGVPTI